MGKEPYMERTGICRTGTGRAVDRFFVLTVYSENGKPGGGTILSYAAGKTYYFDGIAEAALLMDHAMDRQQGEREEGRFRYLKPGGKLEPYTGDSEGCGNVQVSGWEGWNSQSLLNGAGRFESFCIQIYYRENMSWQGELLWNQTGQKQYFRSALELIALVSSAFTA